MTADSRSVLRRWAPPPDFTLSYGEHADQVCDVRLPPRRPSTTAGAPLVIFFHGGFWRHEWDRAHAQPMASGLAAAGYVVATPEYRRTGPAGAGGWPATFDDVAVAAARLPGLIAARVRDSAMQVDPNRLMLSGHSAGGQLALWAATTTKTAAGKPAYARVVALAPVADLRAAFELDLDEGAVLALLGGGPDAVPDRYAATDPMALLPIGTRIEIVHGDQDQYVPVELSRRFAPAASAAGDDVRFTEVPAANHFMLIDPESSVWPAVVRAFA